MTLKKIKSERGEIMIEGMIVMIMTMFILIWVLGVGFLYRVATIVINEHNFEASRVNATITATDDGQTIAAPVISGWSSSGDTHTATVSYSADALYTFDIAYSDKAGNAMADVAEQSFYVDKTMPSVSITEIVDQSANNADTIGFVITATDTNFDVFTPELTAVVQTENGFTTTELNVASISEITNGQVYTVENLETNGIYSIKCTKAKNR